MRGSTSVRVLMIAGALALPPIGGTLLAQTASGEATATRGTAIQVPLSQVTNPKGRLANASVQDKNGDNIGSVRGVITDNAGKATGVTVDVGGFLGVGTRVVEIKANELRYEQERNVLTTTLHKQQIEALAPSKI